MVFVLVALVTAVFSWVIGFFVRRLAPALDAVDHPTVGRKIHTRPIPLLGGVAPFLATALVLIAYALFSGHIGLPTLTDTHIATKHIIGVAIAALVLIVGGFFDDRYSLKPWQQLIAPFVAIGIVIASGIGVSELSHPFGGPPIKLETSNILLFWWNGLPRYFTLWSDVITILWLLGMMYTTKLLDGLDGLVSGMTVIGSLTIGLLSILFFVNIPTALLAFVVAGAFFGFLPHNMHPAKIFLGEGGSLLAGFLLGVLSIMSGAKFATALLVLGIPILDAVWVILRRVCIEKRSPFVGDRGHLHYRLLDAGLSHRAAVFLLLAIASTFGSAALFLQTQQKLLALGVLAILMIILVSVLIKNEQRSMGERDPFTRT